jgi:hypothetical protein
MMSRVAGSKFFPEVFMRTRRSFWGFFLLAASVLAQPAPSDASYQMAPSTGQDLPYSVQTRNLLKHLFNNRTIIGGQVVALRGEPGKEYSGNYIDAGDLMGVKRNDVFALFTPQGEPVGFIRIVDAQRFTASFDFIELTVDPTDDLIAKKVTEEIKDRLPENLIAYPNMRHFHRTVRMAYAKTGPSREKTTSGAGQTPLPPLPSGSSSTENTSASPSALPPLPESGTEPAGTALPPAPDMSTPASSAIPPLPTDNSGMGGLPPEDQGAGNGLPPLPGNGENSPMLPPVGTDSSMPGSSENSLPALPGSPDNSSTGLPPMPGSGTSVPPMPSSDNSALPALPPAASPDMGMPAPSMGTDNSGGAALPPLPAGNPTNPGSSTLPPLSQLSTSPEPVAPLPGTDNGLPPMDTGAGLPPVLPGDQTASLPSDANSLPALDTNAGLPPEPVAQLPGTDNGLPPMDTGAGLPPALPGDQTASLAGDMNAPPPLDNTEGLPSTGAAQLPPMADSSLPPMESPSADASLPPMADSALPPMAAPQAPEVPPSVAMDTGLPPVPGSSPEGLPPLSQPSGASQAGLPPTMESPGMEDLSLPAMPGNGGATASASHAAELGLPAVPGQVRGGYLQDVPTL